jgi:hypothetical protein
MSSGDWVGRFYPPSVFSFFFFTQKRKRAIWLVHSECMRNRFRKQAGGGEAGLDLVSRLEVGLV